MYPSSMTTIRRSLSVKRTAFGSMGAFTRPTSLPVTTSQMWTAPSPPVTRNMSSALNAGRNEARLISQLIFAVRFGQVRIVNKLCMPEFPAFPPRGATVATSRPSWLNLVCKSQSPNGHASRIALGLMKPHVFRPPMDWVSTRQRSDSGANPRHAPSRPPGANILACSFQVAVLHRTMLLPPPGHWRPARKRPSRENARSRIPKPLTAVV